MKKLVLILLMIITVTGWGQEIPKKENDTVKRKGLDIFTKNEDEKRVLTRAAIENRLYNGFVVSNMENVSLTIGGFVQTDAIHDFSENTSPDAFSPMAIVVPISKLNNTTYSIAASRFFIKGDIHSGENKINTILEMDFFKPNNELNLRLAFAEINGFGTGLNWSNFMDLDAFPNTLDYNGPNAMTFCRQIQFRYKHVYASTNELIFSLEDPVSYLHYEDTDKIKVLKFVPDATVSYRYNFKQGYIRGSAVIHPLKYKIEGYNNVTRVGAGVSLSSLYQLKKSKDNFVWQVNYGQGTAKYINDLSGGNEYDAYIDFSNRRLELLGILGATVSYDHWWQNKLSSSIGWSYFKVTDSPSFRSDTFVKSSHFGFTNLIYNVSNFLKVGGELLYGERRNENNQNADNFRIQITTQLLF
jgi:hypothetical protein